MVRLDSSLSQSFRASSGVPQGSHIGPIFFLLFINDIQSCLSRFNVLYLLFYDDLKLYRSIRSVDDFRFLQEALVARKEFS